MSERKVNWVDLWYPRSESGHRDDDQPQAIVVGLMDVRAADNILIEYDFDRDGWKISMATMHWFPVGGPCDPKYAEVAFIPAWATAGKGACECTTCEEEREESQ